MAIKIQNTLDIDLDSVKCCIYGGPGVGKTRTCATAPKPVIISAEKGLLSLADVDCDYIEVNSLKTFDEAYNYLKGKGGDPYKTICLDSLSEIAEVLIAELKPQHKDGRQAYAALSDAMLPMLRKFRDLPNKHVIFTSKLITYVDEDSGSTTDKLLMPGNVLPTQVPYMFDEVFCMQVDRKQVPYFQTAPDRKRFCKDRSGALVDPEMAKSKADVPDMTAIFNKIVSKRKQVQSELQTKKSILEK